jgi:GT2 family glycosyltransferase
MMCGTIMSTGAAVNPKAPRASVIIVNYNGGAALKRCLRSLRDDGGRDYELIVVDNASTDGSAEAVERDFPAVQLIRVAANLGFGEGNNVGVRSAAGQFLAFLNPDTVVEPGWLEPLIAPLEADPRIGLTTARILLLDDQQRINTCGNEMHYTGLTLCRGMGADRSALAEPAEVSAISGAAFVIRRDLFEALGGFDGSFFLYMEDADLSWRARLAGYRCWYVPAAVVYHEYALRFGPRKIFYQERNRYLMLLKGMRWPTLLVLLPALLLAEAVTWGFVLARDRRRLANKARAYAWIAEHWDEIMDHRQRTQAFRRVRDRDLIARCAYRLDYDQTGAGGLARLAHLITNPLFFALQRAALALIWW